MGDVVLLRPYVASKTLRAMAAERRRVAVLALVRGKNRRYRRYLEQAFELDAEAARAEHWENEVELTRRAVAGILEKALEAAQREGA